eukprot:8469475-Pyramimonas_sp.AAC.1
MNAACRSRTSCRSRRRPSRGRTRAQTPSLGPRASARSKSTWSGPRRARAAAPASTGGPASLASPTWRGGAGRRGRRPSRRR